MSRKPRRPRGRAAEVALVVDRGADGRPHVAAAGGRQLAEGVQRALAEAASWHVEDALEGRHVMVVAQDAQVGQRVLDLAALVEARAAHELVGQPVAQEGLLERPALGVGAVHHGDVLAPVDVVVAIVGATGQHGADRSAPGHEGLDLARHPFGLLVLAVGLETLDERARGFCVQSRLSLRPSLRSTTACAASRMSCVER